MRISKVAGLAVAGAAMAGSPARVVLLSDGANTAGLPPDEAAARASEAGVPVDTISVGTADGVIDLNGREVGVPVDGVNLRAVAEKTGGGYHEAGSSEELRAVYDDIGSSVGYRTERRDVSARFIGLGLLVALGVAGTSLAWFSRLP
jgi:Ca-activated chloride channel family protein